MKVGITSNAKCQSCGARFHWPGPHTCTKRGITSVKGGPAAPHGKATESAMEAALVAASIHGWFPQSHWCEGRKYRADFMFQSERVLVEVIGAAHLAGRKKLEEDCERYAIAASKGWLVVTVTAKSIRSGKAVEWIDKALKTRRAP